MMQTPGRRTNDKKCMGLFLSLSVFLLMGAMQASAMDKPLIFPIPQKLQVTGESFVLDETIIIATPKNASEKDMALARLLVKELSNKYGIALKIQSTDLVPKGKKVVIMGSLTNPLVKKYCADNGIKITKENPGKEGYILQVSNNMIVMAGSDEQGAFYGLQSLRQLIQSGNGKTVQGVKVSRLAKPSLPGHQDVCARAG